MSDFENRDVENQAAATAENGQPHQAPETPAAAPSPEPAPSPEAADPSAYYATAPRLTLEPDLEPDLPLPRAPEPEPEPEEPQANPSDFINQDVSALYAVFGQPNGADYGPSCLGSGEDGVLYYDSFTVYTYKDESGERILDVG